MLDKLILSGLFVGLAIYEKSEYYFFHVIGIALVMLVNFFLFKLDTNLLVTTFTITFGLISVFGYKHGSEIYKTLLIGVGLFYGYKIMNVMINVTLKMVLYVVAIGVSSTLGYIYLLDNLGISLDYVEKKEDEPESDHVCALYKNNVFVKFV